MDFFFKKRKIIFKPLPTQLNGNKRAETNFLVPKQNFEKALRKEHQCRKNLLFYKTTDLYL